MQGSISFLVQVTEQDLEPYLAKVNDRALQHSLRYGVGFLYETMPAVEKEVVNRLFASGAIQVIVPPQKQRSSSSQLPRKSAKELQRLRFLASLNAKDMQCSSKILSTTAAPDDATAVQRTGFVGGHGYGWHVLGNDPLGFPGGCHGYTIL